MLDEFKELIENNPISIATSDNDFPNLAVASAVEVVSGGGQLIIGHNEMVKTVENIRQNKNVCLTSFDKEWQGVRIYGKAEYFTDGEWFKKCQELSQRRVELGLAEPPNTPIGVILVTAEKVEKQS